MPEELVGLFLDPYYLVSVIIKEVSEGFDAYFDLHLQG
jgi:hypothetical protein